MILLSCSKEKQLELDNGVVIPVNAVPVVSESMEAAVQYPAIIQAKERADMGTKIPGRVKAIHVREGQTVRTGQLLLELASGNVEAKLAQAEAAVAEVTAHYENSKKDLERFEDLSKSKAITEKELENSQLAFRSAEARKFAAEQAKKEVEELIDDIRPTAPFPGEVVKIFVDVGDLVAPGQPMIIVEDTRQLEAVVKIPESEIKDLSVGMPVKLIVPASTINKPDKMVETEISQVVSSADPMSHQYEVRSIIKNTNGFFRPGMFVRLAIGISESETLVIPKTAVFKRGQLEGVYTIDSENRARLRWIRTGREYGNQVEILSGLQPGELVITEKDSDLAEGNKVEVIK
jgi:RND family efflux transporter MFP subunit